MRRSTACLALILMLLLTACAGAPRGSYTARAATPPRTITFEKDRYQLQVPYAELHIANGAMLVLSGSFTVKGKTMTLTAGLEGLQSELEAVVREQLTAEGTAVTDEAVNAASTVAYAIIEKKYRQLEGKIDKDDLTILDVLYTKN